MFGWFVLAGLPQPSCPILSLLLRNDHLHPPSSMQGCAALLPWVRRQRMCRQLMYLKVPFFLRRRNTVAQSLGYVEMGHDDRLLCLCKVRACSVGSSRIAPTLVPDSLPPFATTTCIPRQACRAVRLSCLGCMCDLWLKGAVFLAPRNRSLKASATWKWDTCSACARSAVRAGRTMR